MRRIIRASFLVGLIAVACYYFYPYEPIPINTVVDKIEVYKSKHELLAFSNDKLVKSFVIALGHTPVGPKEMEGDMKTPEGEYLISSKNANSNFYRSLLISYPNSKNKKLAAQMNVSAGGDVEIHGLRSDYAVIKRFHRWRDWTDGCIALTNEEVKDLYEHTPVGTRIIIYP